MPLSRPARKTLELTSSLFKFGKRWGPFWRKLLKGLWQWSHMTSRGRAERCMAWRVCRRYIVTKIRPFGWEVQAEIMNSFPIRLEAIAIRLKFWSRFLNFPLLSHHLHWIWEFSCRRDPSPKVSTLFCLSGLSGEALVAEERTCRFWSKGAIFTIKRRRESSEEKKEGHRKGV